MLIPIIFTAVLVCFLVVQIFLLVKTYLLVRQTNYLLYELKFLIAQYKSDHLNKTGQSRICKNCMFRMTYINIANRGDEDTFYYKCKLHHREVALRDNCGDFKRYTAPKRI
jgi:hypothetical protein